MKIQYASDIHLELSDNSRFINRMPFEVTGDVLVFAGDIGYLRDKTLPNIKFWKWASANYREVLLVPGNHEFYGNGDVLAYGDSWSREILPNVHYYQNKGYALMIRTSFSLLCGRISSLRMSLL